MRTIVVLSCLLAAVFWSRAVQADIYIWEDEDGVKHISDLNPPPQAKVFLRTPPRDASAETPEQEAEPLRAIEEDRFRERENRWEVREKAWERRMSAAEEDLAAARSALEAAEDRLEAVERRYDRDSRYAGSLVYAPRFFAAPRYNRFKRHQFGKKNRSGPTVFKGRPFQLGTIHLPLFNARDHFRRPRPHDLGGSQFERRQHERPGRGPHRRDGRRR